MKKLTIGSLCFFAIFAFSCKTVDMQTSEGKFGGGEHLMLGDEGYRRALGHGKGDSLDKIYREDRLQEFTYGELVALSGDFYAQSDALYFEKTQTLGDRFINGKYNDVAAGIAAIKAEIPDIEKQKDLSGSQIADQNGQYGKIFGTAYLEMALCNEDHFGWNNMKRYIAEHQKALDFAKQAHDTPTENKKLRGELLNRAMFQNSFADHFLTDGFASGHVRVPRLQAIKLNKIQCPKSSSGFFSRLLDLALPNDTKRIGVMAKIQHDNDQALIVEKLKNDDPKDKTEKFEIKGGGLLVRNSMGTSWHARPDNQLFLAANSDDSVVQIAVRAVELSVREVLETYETGRIPKGIFKATELVPFIDPKEKTAFEIFSSLSDSQIEQLLAPANTTMGKLQGYFSGVDLAFAKAYFKRIPEYMQKFRDDVAADVKAMPEIRKRLPEKYIQGYLNVQ